VSSEEEGDDDDDDDACIASGDDLDSDSAFMYLYAESEALGLISPEEQERLQQRLQQRLRMKREKEENAILQLPAEEFLGMWARLVTQPMVAAEPRIYDDMRNWLVCEPLDALWECAWRANRRYEKLPDVQTSASDDDDDDDSDSDGAGVGQARRSASAASACSDLTELQSKVARLALIANYLTFAWRWRKLREPAPGSVPGSVPEAGAADAQSDVISISTEGETSGSASPHNDGAAQAVSPRNGHEMGLSEAESPTRRHRDAIFEKARALAGPEPGSPDSAAPAGRQAAVVNAIDNGSEGCTPSELSLDDSGDEKDDVDTAMADGNDGNDEQESDNDLDTPTSKHAQLLRDEQDEYALFVGKLKEAASDTPAERSGTYRAARVELERELQELRVRLRDSQRSAAGVERDMVEDIRMLLTLFGIPYITAPLEAEAQCAALVAQQLVDGMVTDDSDAFLFASTSRTRVYRHFFQKDRYVEMYSGEGIYQDSSLVRRDLVFLACLLGSDYTVGIKGIGPVLAMEALAEFGPSTTGDADAGDASDDEARVASALRRFRAWCDLVAGVLPGLAVPDDIAGTPRRRRLAQVVRKAGVPPGFPSLPAVHAYFCPQVDPSEAKLEWGFPRLDMLRQFMSDRLGWPADKTDETLVPVARKMAEAGGPGGGLAQPTLDAFVRPAAPPPGAGLPAAGVGHSKRVGAAISLHKRRQAGGAMQN
ncbi:DNA repair protein rad2, partial [Coemansia nantahalensis]